MANAVAPIVFCDTDGVNDGETTVDITSITPLILGAQDPTVFTVDYYLSEQEAIAQQNALTAAQAANFVTGSTTLWAQVSNNVNSCTDRTAIAIIIHALPEFTFNDPSVVCFMGEG